MEKRQNLIHAGLELVPIAACKIALLLFSLPFQVINLSKLYLRLYAGVLALAKQLLLQTKEIIFDFFASSDKTKLMCYFSFNS